MDWIVSQLVWIWTFWWIGFALIFAIFESIALSRNGLTLSMYVWHISERWPLIIWLMGVLAGGLAVHFWWHWNPPNSVQLGLRKS